MEHSDTGSPTGITYDISASPNDIAYKYDMDFDGPGFFVGDWNTNTIHLYGHFFNESGMFYMGNHQSWFHRVISGISFNGARTSSA